MNTIEAIENELLQIERKISKLEKDLVIAVNNASLAKKIKTKMNLLIGKAELLEQKMYLIQNELRNGKENKLKNR